MRAREVLVRRARARGSHAPNECSLGQEYNPDQHYRNRREFRDPRLPWEPLQPRDKWQHYSNDKRLPRLDAEVEADEGRGQSARREPYLSERPREAKAMHQSEKEADYPTPRHHAVHGQV